MAESILEVLRDIGEVTEELKKCILEQKDTEVLKCWLKAAIKADSIEDFGKLTK